SWYSTALQPVSPPMLPAPKPAVVVVVSPVEPEPVVAPDVVDEPLLDGPPATAPTGADAVVVPAPDDARLLVPVEAELLEPVEPLPLELASSVPVELELLEAVSELAEVLPRSEPDDVPAPDVPPRVDPLAVLLLEPAGEVPQAKVAAGSDASTTSRMRFLRMRMEPPCPGCAAASPASTLSKRG